MPALFFRQLARFGCAATAIVYILIGVIAILSLLKIKHGGADEASLLRFLEDVPLGKVIILIILSGMLAYIVWRFYEAINDPYDYGSEWQGMVIRIITACSAVSDALIGWPALESLLGNNTALKDGEPTVQRQAFAQLLETGYGKWLIGTIGLVTSITAIVQFIYVARKAYTERIDFKKLVPFKKSCIHALAWSGHVARGTILGIMGFFMIKASATNNAQVIVNTDKAFDFLGDDVSHLVFALVAIGTIAYGIFMLALGYYYDFKKGK